MGGHHDQGIGLARASGRVVRLATGPHGLAGVADGTCQVELRSHDGCEALTW